MHNITDCLNYQPWKQHPGSHTDAFAIGYEGFQPWAEAPFEPDMPRAEREIQLKNIAKLEACIIKVKAGLGTIEMLHAAGNPFMHDAQGRQIPGRELYTNPDIPKACSTTVTLEAHFMAGFPRWLSKS